MSGAAVLLALRTLRPRTLAAISGRLECVLPPASWVCYPPWSSSPVRTLQVCPALCAGHNKWSKVKHIKGPKDMAKNRLFGKFSLMIKIAVKEGGSNPGINKNLANVLEQCRSKNMPNSSIENAIKNASKPSSMHLYEARGPGGCLLLIEVLTDHSAQTLQEVNRLLNKNSGKIADGARHNFIKRGLVVVPGQDVSTERALELAIDAGAEDVQETKDEEEQPVLQFICDVMAVHKVRASLEEQGMQITSAGLDYVPRNVLSLDEDQLAAVSKLIDLLSENPKVVQIWDNIQPDS
ncbi:translational activator of cytochrome c oxidase 1 [Cottoperca gobio]|uniref:Translational activator of cytochrome c oxidase 1 n=1 Tax=Cottoperca gobio TaxID=56716 RepID=A0A6J2RQQ5_COTGO|nr:translational activator of cytochrome c oxidase 1 [Cottoperca gobio]XP_029311640.1 translational activator of cytochrome c oxidase 1 [Cottoperca gobio]